MLQHSEYCNLPDILLRVSESIFSQINIPATSSKILHTLSNFFDLINAFISVVKVTTSGLTPFKII